MSGPEYGAVRILAAGEDLRLPEHEYRLVAGRQLDVPYEKLRELEQLAATHGAVLLEIHEGEDEWVPAVLVRVEAPWSILELGDAKLGVAASNTSEELGAWHFVALVGELRCAPIGWQRAAPSRSPEFLLAYRDASGGYAWETAAWRLVPHPLVPRAFRDWAWVWTRAYGPLTLRVRLEVSRPAIEQLLLGAAPLPYDPIERGLRARAFREPNERAAELCSFESGLLWVRSHVEPTAAVIAFDAGLLVALARGALGPLTWDVVDEDYYEYLASGEDGASLAEYLSPASDAEAQRAAWDALHARRICDATAATTIAEVFAILSTFLGAATPVAEAAFITWLHTRDIRALPRNIELQVSKAMHERHASWLCERLAHTRMQWCIASG